MGSTPLAHGSEKRHVLGSWAGVDPPEPDDHMAEYRQSLFLHGGTSMRLVSPYYPINRNVVCREARSSQTLDGSWFISLVNIDRHTRAFYPGHPI